MKRTTISDHETTISEAVALAKSRGEVALQGESIATLQKARREAADILAKTGGRLKIGSPGSQKLNRAQDTRDALVRQILDHVQRAAIMLFDRVKAAKTDQGSVRSLLGWLASTEPHHLSAKETDQLIALVRP